MINAYRHLRYPQLRKGLHMNLRNKPELQQQLYKISLLIDAARSPAGKADPFEKKKRNRFDTDF